MTNEKRKIAIDQVIQKKIRKFSRIEKAFWGAFIITAITMAVSIIYLQVRNMQVQQEITSLNSKISDKQTALNNAKQEVNELSRADRIKEIAEKAGLSIQRDNIQSVE